MSFSIGPTTRSLMQPIGTLPVFEDAMRVWILEATPVLEELQLALHNGHHIDEDRGEAIAGFYLGQVDEHWLLETQLDYWQHQPLSLADAEDVRLLAEQARSLLILSEAILTAITDLYRRDKPAKKVPPPLGYWPVDDELHYGTLRQE